MFPCLAIDRYFYFDWNVFVVFRDFTSPLAGPLLTSIRKGKKKGFFFPFSEAHIRDLFNKSNFIKNEYTQKNFNAIRRLSDGICLAYAKDPGAIQLHRIDVEDVFKSLRKEHDDQSYLPEELFGKNFYDELRYRYLNDSDKFIQELSCNGHFEAANIVKCLSTKDEDYLSKNFIRAVKSLHNITKSEEPPRSYMIQNGFRFLDFTILFNEKITKKNAPLNVMNDSNHLYAASDSKFFVTEDEALIRKITFFKKCYPIQTTPIKIEQFCNFFCDCPPPIALP